MEEVRVEPKFSKGETVVVKDAIDPRGEYKAGDVLTVSEVVGVGGSDGWIYYVKEHGRAMWEEELGDEGE